MASDLLVNWPSLCFSFDNQQTHCSYFVAAQRKIGSLNVLLMCFLKRNLCFHAGNIVKLKVWYGEICMTQLNVLSVAHCGWCDAQKCWLYKIYWVYLLHTCLTQNTFKGIVHLKININLPHVITKMFHFPVSLKYSRMMMLSYSESKWWPGAARLQKWQ